MSSRKSRRLITLVWTVAVRGPNAVAFRVRADRVAAGAKRRRGTSRFLFVIAVAATLPERENVSFTPCAGSVQGTPTRQTGIVGPRFT